MEIAIAAIAIVAIAAVVLSLMLMYQHRRTVPYDIGGAGPIPADPANSFRGVVKELASSGPLEARLEVRGPAGPGWSPASWREDFSRPRGWMVRGTTPTPRPAQPASPSPGQAGTGQQQTRQGS